MGINQKRLSLPLGSLLWDCLFVQSQACTRGPTEAQEYIETVTVVGTKTEEIGEVAGALTIISEDEIDRRMMRDIADLIKYEPGVSRWVLVSDGGFPAFQFGVSVGIEFFTLVDGVQVPEVLSFGPFLNARRDCRYRKHGEYRNRKRVWILTFMVVMPLVWSR